MRYAKNRDRLGTRLRTTLRLMGVCGGVLLLASSCQRKEAVATELGDITINVVPSFASVEGSSNNAPYNKATLDAFNPNDKVGLYVVYQKNGTSQDLSNVEAKWENLRYTANSSGILTRIAPDKPIYYDKNSTEKVDLYAYFPYNENLLKADLKSYSFSVQTDQQATGALNNSDLCWAKNEKGAVGGIGAPVTPRAKPLEMHFEHLFSKINITIKVPLKLGADQTVTGLSNTRLHNIAKTVKLDLSTGVATTQTTEPVAIITPRTGSTSTDATWNSYTFEAIIPAQTMAANSAVLSFNVLSEDGTNTALTPVPFTLYAPGDLFGSDKLSCVKGKLYKWEITVGASTGGGTEDGGRIEVKLEGSTIKAWDTGTPPVSGDLTNSITTKFSFTHSNITAGVNRVQVTTNESAKIYDIKNTTANPTAVAVSGTTCTFNFTRESSSPRDYGFSITNLVFLENETTKHTWTGISARVYSPTTMVLNN